MGNKHLICQSSLRIEQSRRNDCLKLHIKCIRKTKGAILIVNTIANFSILVNLVLHLLLFYKARTLSMYYSIGFILRFVLVTLEQPLSDERPRGLIKFYLT